MKTYGAFHNDILIFSHVMTYAIYEKKNFAESFMREMQGYYPDELYSVQEIELGVEVAHGGDNIGDADIEDVGVVEEIG